MTRIQNSLVLALALSACTKGEDTTDKDTLDTALDSAGIELDNNDDIATAEDVTGGTFLFIDRAAQNANYLSIGDGIIAPEGDRDFFAVTLEADNTYHIVTLAYALQNRVVLDTVLRLYDANGQMITENDDMVFRFLETDSAIVYTPPTTGTYYIEVLDYGDWWLSNGGDSQGGQIEAQGGTTYEYVLVAAKFPNTEADPNQSLADVYLGDGDVPDVILPIDTDVDTDADTDVVDTDPGAVDTSETDLDTFVPADTTDSDLADTEVVDTEVEDTEVVDTDVTTDTGDDPTAEFYIPSWLASYSRDFHGGFSDTNDLDYWPIKITLQSDVEQRYAFVTFSAWEDVGSNADAKMTLIDSDGMVLASSSDLIPGSNRLWFDDVGLISRVDDGGIYYLRVESTTGTFGQSSKYTGITFTYLPSLADPEEEGNDTRATANFAPLEANDAGTAYLGGVWGTLPASDPGDWYRIAGADVGGLDGKYVSVFMKAAEVGSQLDPKITLYTADGTEIETYSVDEALDDSKDPAVRDYLVSGESDLYFQVGADARGNSDPAQQYIVGIIVANSPVF